MIAAGLALVLPLVVEIDKWIRRRRQHPPASAPVEEVVAPGRAAVRTG